MTKQSQVQLIPIDNIRVSAVNTRELDETTLEELTASIKAPGPKKKYYAYKASRVLVSARALRSMKVRLDQMAGELAELEKKAKENGKA